MLQDIVRNPLVQAQNRLALSRKLNDACITEKYAQLEALAERRATTRKDLDDLKEKRYDLTLQARALRTAIRRLEEFEKADGPGA